LTVGEDRVFDEVGHQETHLGLAEFFAADCADCIAIQGSLLLAVLECGLQVEVVGTQYNGYTFGTVAGTPWESVDDLAGGLLDASIFKSLDCCIGLRDVAFAVVRSQLMKSYK
jgi:hypothetical protein